MNKKITIGGDRLGSGNKQKQELHNYFRSTFDLSQKFRSPMTVGALYPFLVLPAMRNDKFEFEFNCDCITVPTQGPLFGSFKLQLDVFECPIRLYQAILHNNPTNIGLKMNQVMLPKYILQDEYIDKPNPVKNSSLWKYLGLSGLGKNTINEGLDRVERAINAVPLLAYYDIFKNYYANKQEEYAYVIGGTTESIYTAYKHDQVNGFTNVTTSYDYPISSQPVVSGAWKKYYVYFKNENGDEPYGDVNMNFTFKLTMINSDDEEVQETFNYAEDWVDNSSRDNAEAFRIYPTPWGAIYIEVGTDGNPAKYGGERIISWEIPTAIEAVEDAYKLQPFKLKNIDDMRMTILSQNELGVAYDVARFNELPYKINNYQLSKTCELNGLVVKTYQSDLFNNWVNTDWIDGENGIAEITKVATSEGSFKIDQLVMAQKLYNMLNRVAISGGTYEDWQDAVYDEAPHKHIESPIYLGGMSSEIVFEQIVSHAATEGQPLGDLAGRGRYVKRKGGHVAVKCNEACFIIGIVSITPRITYSQGNEFYMTELKSLDDLHKPALDGIGFQNLLGERLAWWDTKVLRDSTMQRSVIGKVPAWMEYMTAVDKTFGDFAEDGGKAFMSLNRNYEMDENGNIKDATTYIDPTKYNYAFAVSDLRAQNFWCEILSKITARRKMSSKQIPNL